MSQITDSTASCLFRSLPQVLYNWYPGSIQPSKERAHLLLGFGLQPVLCFILTTNNRRVPYKTRAETWKQPFIQRTERGLGKAYLKSRATENETVSQVLKCSIICARYDRLVTSLTNCNVTCMCTQITSYTETSVRSQK